MQHNLIPSCLYFYSGLKAVAAITSRTGQPSVHHTDCEVLVGHGKGPGRCSPCSQHRHLLRTMVARAPSLKDVRTNPSSHTNFTVLNTPDKNEILRRLRIETKSWKRRADRLMDEICVATAITKADIDESLDADLRSMMSNCTDLVNSTYPERSFQRLFWEQQQKAASLNNSRSMKWHPLFIKWCLYLRHLSGKAYELLRDSGCVKLPSQRTLRDYTHYISSAIGFSVEIDEQLLQVSDLSVERNRCVVLNNNVCMCNV